MLTLSLMLSLNAANASTALVVDATSDLLLEIDTTTLATGSSVALPTPYDFGDAAYDGATGILYIVYARPTQELWAYDTNSGAFSLVGTLAVNEIFAAGFDDVSGTLYAIQNSTRDLYTIDTSTAATTFIANTGVSADGGYWDEARNAFVVNQIGAQTFYEVASNGTATQFASNGTWTDNNDFDFDPSTGSVFAWDWSRNQYTYDGFSFALLSQTSSGFSSDAMAIIDGGPTGPRFAGTGTCPGPMSISISGLTPGGRVAVARGTGPGAAVIPAGPCAGRSLAIASPSLVGTFVIPPSGTLSVNPTFGPGQCNKAFQAVDLATCATTNVWQP